MEMLLPAVTLAVEEASFLPKHPPMKSKDLPGNRAESLARNRCSCRLIFDEFHDFIAPATFKSAANKVLFEVDKCADYEQ
jgi:hypothetical protein